MSTFPFRLLSAIPRRLLEHRTPRQLAWHLRFLAFCLVATAARQLSVAASRVVRGTRNRLLGVRRIWTSPKYLALVVIARRSPRPKVRIRLLTCDLR